MASRILLADDHAIVRDGLRLILETDPGIVVVGDADDGQKAVSQVGLLSPDVVIMDIAMPTLDGIEATRLIRASHPATQVAILSMHATSEHIYQALKAGAMGYLLKESAGKEVIMAIRAIQGGHRYLSDKISATLMDAYVRQREAAASKSPIESLSDRERQILLLVVEGKSSVEIAKMINISAKTVETYRSRLMKKLNVNEITSLVKFALEHGLTAS